MPKSLVEGKVELASLESALDKANVVVVLVNHKEFKTADAGQFAAKVVIDTRGII
jgi:UDP-N-acetyl-D-mannosaminuronic acid dehydrogenase